jgi:hypothetical protein
MLQDMGKDIGGGRRPWRCAGEEFTRRLKHSPDFAAVVVDDPEPLAEIGARLP